MRVSPHILRVRRISRRGGAQSRGSKFRTATAMLLALALAVLGVVALGPRAHALSTSGEFNYAEALQDSMTFYESQRSGQLAPDNPVDWRGDSDLTDGSDNAVNLTGGFHDAGDLVKFGLPEAYSMTMLAWGLIDYGAGYSESGQTQSALENLRWGDDYILSAFTGPTTFYGQVANPSTDHQYWGPAETNPVTRPSYAITATCPGSDLAGEASAALAASSIAFKSTDPKYAAQLLTKSQGLWTFANDYQGDYSNCITAAQGYYTSSSGYWSQLVEGAIWLYRATGTASWLTTAENDFPNLPLASQSTTQHEYNWTICWDDDSYADYILLAELTNQTQYIDDAEDYLDWWTTGFDGSEVSYSPGGEAFLNQWGSLRYSANTAYAALEFSGYLTANGLDPTRATKYHNFAVGQINYILGDNPNHESYEVGFTNSGTNTSWSQYPHNSTAHDSWADNLTTPAQTRHLDYGLLVGGPTSANDQFTDNRSDYQYTEGALDYNALFSGALAGLTEQYGGTPVANFPKAELPDGPQEYIQASINNEGTDFIEIKALINNQSAWPARPMPDASFRYYFTLDAGETASQVTLSSSYNQCNAISAPTQLSGSTYYITVNCSNLNIEPVGEDDYTNDDYQAQVQFRLTFPAAHNPAEDWSFQGIPSTVGATPATVGNIPLYSGNTLVWGSGPTASAPPSTPGAVSASAVTTTGATLSWTASTPGTNPIAGYDVYSSAGTLFATVGPSTTSYALTGLNASRTSPYGYFVTAVDTRGLASAASDIAQFVTSPYTSLAAADTTAPSMPGTPVASAIGTGGATLTWAPSIAGTNPVAGYDVYELSPAPVLVATTGKSATSYALTGLSPGTEYGYEVAALDTTGRISPVLAAVSFTTLGSASASPSPTASPSVSASASTSPTPTASASPTKSSSPSPTPSPSSSPSASASATASTTPSPTGAPGSCSAVYSLTNSWSGGFQGQVVITDTGSAAVAGWTLAWTFPGDQKINDMWSATYAQTGETVSATAESYDADIAPNSSVTVGFTGTYTNSDASPTSFTLDGAPCS
jgi:endoglucanase